MFKFLHNFKIEDKKIGIGCKPYLVAEISANHNGSLKTALKTIKLAKESGADAIKLQTYTPKTMTINVKRKDFYISKGQWKGNYLYDLYKKAHTPLEWHKEIFDYTKYLGITCFSSAFDETAVDFLEKNNIPAYKIASFEATDLELIKYACSTNKPIIISTGLASKKEINDIINDKLDKNDNPLKHAPHTAVYALSDEWNHLYSRSLSCYPGEWQKDYKYWPPVGRIDNAFGDRNLVCTCPPIDSYKDTND